MPALLNACNAAAKHVRPTCSGLYDQLDSAIKGYRATHPAAGGKVRELVDRLVTFKTDEGTPLGDFFFANVSSDYLRPYMEAALAQPQLGGEDGR